MISNLIITYHNFKKNLRQNKFNKQYDRTINHDLYVNKLKGMNKEDLVLNIQIDQINNEMIKIKLNSRLIENRGFSATNDNVHCTTISQIQSERTLSF